MDTNTASSSHIVSKVSYLNSGFNGEVIVITAAHKLSTQYNLHWSLLRWVASFLQGRAQVTRVGASVSAPSYLTGGIPKGTKLGPVLFAVMVNDLVQSWGARIKFVDDLTVLEVVPRNSPSILNVVVDDIHAFAVNNNMRLNPRK